jgi:hypothetical protein
MSSPGLIPRSSIILLSYCLVIMKLYFALLLAGVFNIGVNALTLVKKDNPAILSIPFKRTTTVPASQRKRGGTTLSDLHNEQLVYTIDIIAGTPPQQMLVQLDTGSSDLIVETSSSNLCFSNPIVCGGHGSCKSMLCDAQFLGMY